MSEKESLPQVDNKQKPEKQNSQPPRKISRREFLRGAALAAGAVAAKPAIDFLSSPTKSVSAEGLNVPEPDTTIAGIETFGTPENPVNFDEHEALRFDINNKVANGEITIEDDVVYFTAYVDPETYKIFRDNNYPADYGGLKYEEFLNLQIAKAKEMVDDGNSAIQSSGLSIKDIKVQRLIVYQGFQPELSTHLGYLNQRFDDSDGISGTNEQIPHLPHTYARWDPVNKISPELIHEWIHRWLLRATDHYRSDTTFVNSDQALRGIPAHFWKYETNKRVDRDNPNIMTDPATLRLGTSIMWQTAGLLRDGDLHNLTRTIPNSNAYPYEGKNGAPMIANDNIFELGQTRNGKVVTVYRTERTNTPQERTLVLVFQGQVVDGKVNIGNPFNGAQENIVGRNMISDDRSVLVIRVEDQISSDNPEYWEGDFRSFYQAYEELGRPADGIIYSPQLFNANTTYENAPWDSQFNYRRAVPSPTTTPTNSPTSTLQPTQPNPTATPPGPSPSPSPGPTNQPQPTPTPWQRFKTFLPGIFNGRP